MGVRKGREWPRNLLPLAHVLFQLQRESFLGPSTTRDPDERLIGVNMLLSASSGAALKMILPRLFTWGTAPGSELHELPSDLSSALGRLSLPSAADLKGRPKETLLLDSGCSVLVVPSNPLSSAAMGELRHWVVANASPTGVVPEVRFSSDMTELVNRLIPLGGLVGSLNGATGQAFLDWCQVAGVVIQPGTGGGNI